MHEKVQVMETRNGQSFASIVAVAIKAHSLVDKALQRAWIEAELQLRGNDRMLLILFVQISKMPLQHNTHIYLQNNFVFITQTLLWNLKKERVKMEATLLIIIIAVVCGMEILKVRQGEMASILL
jgi:hypothetical protein